MEEIGVQEVGEDIGGTQVIIGKDYGMRGEDLVSYVEWGKCGAVKNVWGSERGVSWVHNGHNTMGRDGSRCMNG